MLKTAFGLTVAAELDLPELPPARDAGQVANVEIAWARVPDPPIAGRRMGPLLWTSPTELALNIPGVAHFRVSQGKRIEIDPHPGADEPSIRLFLLGSAFGALLLQRGFFVLHASAIEIDGAAMAAVGTSGIGKSTLAEGFRRRGFRILSDDVVAVDPHGLAPPGIPRIKLWQDVTERLGIDAEALSPVRPNLAKYDLRVAADATQESLPLRWIYALRVHSGEEVAIAPVTGHAAFTLLRDNSYRRRFVDGMGLNGAHLQLSQRLSADARIAAVKRPEQGFALDALVDAILRDVRG